ncbi:(2Fe-2S)-binding protein [Maritalea mediterranea]|uniref:(2Fe-2S)-binding protein n=1 Tax=Maritalea mediterranea TaxID=2909667 RepID=A0ABS9E5K4_9HYPH|nr:(2Fe-2S)-binding protein [Maritalea mediterranea]MCF4098149.1 (2Fe-2S)-binding protein [Maritalea mediterranea]
MPRTDIAMERKLETLLPQINRDHSAFAPRFSLQVVGGEAQNIGAITPAQLPYYFKLATAKYENADAKMGAAFCLGRLSWAMLRPLAGYALNEFWFAGTDLAAFELSMREVPWQKQGESGVFQAIDIALDGNGAVWHERSADPYTIADFATQIEALFAPLVEMHHQQSGLARPALWRLVGDSLATSLLIQGENFGCLKHAISIGEQILQRKGTKLYSKQSNFIEVKLPERPEISEWFRKRGGCCRYYTADGGEYCSTCVLRDEDSMIERLQNHLRSKYLGEEAA